jgi:hypothetical protein
MLISHLAAVMLAPSFSSALHAASFLFGECGRLLHYGVGTDGRPELDHHVRRRIIDLVDRIRRRRWGCGASASRGA